MAESTLSITYDELAVIVAVFLGYSPTKTDWSALEVAELDRYIQAGIRQFYYPPAVDGVPEGYEWSFLKPTTTIEVNARYTTGSLVVAGGTCTLTGGTWPEWAATHGTLVIDDVTYSITSRDNDTELTVVGSDTTADEDDWYLSNAGYQDLPDDLGRVIGSFYYPSTEHRRSVIQVSKARINAGLARTTDEAPPRECTVRYKTQVPGEGQRMEVVWFPKPNAIRTLTYTYEAYTGTIDTSTNPYPLGGMKYAELVTESCLAIAEQRANDEQGLHTAAFVRLLAAGITYDKRQGASHFGPMSPDSDIPTYDYGSNRYPYTYAGSPYPVSYKGETW